MYRMYYSNSHKNQEVRTVFHSQLQKITTNIFHRQTELYNIYTEVRTGKYLITCVDKKKHWTDISTLLNRYGTTVPVLYIRYNYKRLHVPKVQVILSRMARKFSAILDLIHSLLVCCNSVLIDFSPYGAKRDPKAHIIFERWAQVL
jgi:hypothetical protein